MNSVSVNYIWNISHSIRTNDFQSSTKVIQLTLYTSLELFHYLISDIIQATLRGITSFDAYGKQIVIFMGVLVLIQPTLK